MTSLLVEIIVILILILLNGLFAMSELALVSVRRARLLVMERRGVKNAAFARTLAEDPQRFFPTVQVGITLVGILAGVFGGARIAQHLESGLMRFPSLAPFAQPLALAIVVVMITFLTMIFGELVPKQLALRQPELIAVGVARPIALLSTVAAPIVWVLGKSSGIVLRLFGLHRASQQSVTEEELRALLAEGTQTGVLEIEERDMIERVLRLADKPVRAIMTPRTDLVWLDRSDPPKEIRDTLRSAPYSRFVVCDGVVDNVVGVIHAKDILDRMLTDGALTLGPALRQPIVVPDTVTALDALERLKGDPVGLALVMDEYGSFEGVVTETDVLEAIVGDPTDATPPPATDADGHETMIVMDGMMPVDELKARLMLPDLPAAGSYHTLGGLILALLRRVPRAGDRVVFADWRFEVLAMDGRRVDKVRATREPLAAQ